MAMKRKLNNAVVTALGLGITIGIAVIIAVILMVIFSKEPAKTMYYFFLGPFSNRYYLGNMLNSSIPLIFTGLGIAVAFKSSVFNLGGEGQIYAGALITTAVCLALPGFNGVLGGILALAAGMLSGALLAGLSGYFRMK